MQTGKSRFLIILSSLLILGFMLTSFISYWVARSSLEDQIAESTLPLTSDNIYSEIQQDLLRPIFISSIMAQDTFLRDWILAGETDIEPITRYLESIQTQYDTITSYFISDRTGNYYHPSGILKTISADDPADAWYFRARALKTDYEINVDLDTADRARTTIFINYRVFDFDGDFIGIAGVGLEITAVGHLIDLYQERYDREVYFIDREGNIALHGSQYAGPKSIRQRPHMAPHVTKLLTTPSTAFSFEEGGSAHYVNSRLVPEFNWYLIVEQTGTPGTDDLNTSLFVNLAAALFITGLTMGLVWFTVGSYQTRLERMASTDKLTGLLNRQSFELDLELHLGKAKKQDKALSVILVDVDHFKTINDRFGHLAGDRALVHICDTIRAVIREGDLACRWGGEEFLILAPESDKQNAVDMAERMRSVIAATPMQFGEESVNITASIGVAQSHFGESSNHFIQRADEALYEAKHAGRNKVIVA